jgi:energy-coupling factor transporter transmembrane protein EcfT
MPDFNQTRTYRWAWWTLLLNFTTSLYIVPMLSIVIAIFGLIIALAFRDGKIDWISLTVAILFSPFILILLFFWLWFLLYPFGRLFFSYFKVSENGLEYRYWPSYGVRCTWDDLEQLGNYKSLGFIPYDVLNLKKGEPLGWPITMMMHQRLGLKTQYSVPLTGIQGWPNGELANQLRHFAPQLFGEMDSPKTVD